MGVGETIMVPLIELQVISYIDYLSERIFSKTCNLWSRSRYVCTSPDLFQSGKLFFVNISPSL